MDQAPSSPEPTQIMRQREGWKTLQALDSVLSVMLGNSNTH